MRIGVLILPEFPWPTARNLWRQAEELGFDHAWTYDHLAWRSLRDSPWFAAIPTLTAAATATERIRLGTLVASPNFRHPVPFAKELITLDDVSAGRLTLGIGAGSTGWDATMLGQAELSRHERADQFAEFVDLLDRLLREPETSFKGQFYSAHEARSYPGCTQRPRIPFAIAATGRRGMRLAANYGESWVTTGDRTTERPLGAREGAMVVREQITQLDEVCAKLGRDPALLRRLVVTGPNLDGGLGSVEAFRDTIGRYADVGVTDLVVHWPRRDGPYAGDLSTFEQIIVGCRRRDRRLHGCAPHRVDLGRIE
jgi:alkanesulfonate monooxygenase SsuD/methylene tetrahydromethanopterin reductase-like flavin-dependent oxidoreductase (luciferase family)